MGAALENLGQLLKFDCEHSSVGFIIYLMAVEFEAKLLVYDSDVCGVSMPIA